MPQPKMIFWIKRSVIQYIDTSYWSYFLTNADKRILSGEKESEWICEGLDHPVHPSIR